MSNTGKEFLYQYNFATFDESGNLGLLPGSSRYFVLACFMYDDEHLGRKIKKFISKLSKKRHVHMLHARDDNDAIRVKVVKFLRKIKWNALVLVFDKNKYKNLKRIDYADLVDKILKEIKINNEIIISTPIVGKNIVNELTSLNSKVRISGMHKDVTLQLADFVAWATYKKFEDNEDLYFKLISENIAVLEYKKDAKQNP